MYRHIFRYEFRKMTSDRTLWILTAILFAFTLLSIFNGSRWVAFQSENISEIASGQEHRLEKHIRDIDDYNRENDFVRTGAPHNASSIGTYTMHYIVKPPHPNALFAIGQSDLYPYYIRFSAIDRANMLLNEEIVNPVNLLIGKLDFSFFIIYLLPLLVIAMTYDLLSSEGEQGTLTLLRIYQPRTVSFFLTKWLFRVLWMLLALYVAVFTGILLFSPFAFSEFDLGTLGAVAVTTVYALFWFSLCFSVNMLGRNSLFNGIALTMFWLFIVFLLPTIFNTVMQKKYPLPSRTEQIVRQREVKEEVDEQKVYLDYLSSHPEYRAFDSDTVGKSIVTRWYPAYIVSVAAIDSINDQGERKFSEALKLQEKGLETLSFVSPSLMVNLVYNTVSRNSFYDFVHFDRQFRARQQQWRSFVYDRILRGQIFTTADLGYQSNFINSPSRDFSVSHVLAKVFWIFFLSVVLLWFGIVRFKKRF